MCPFMKRECPKTDDGKKGCTLWVKPGIGPTKVFKALDGKFPPEGMCAFHLLLNLLWDANFSLIGNQQAVESFRNNMHDSMPVMLKVMQHGFNPKALNSPEDS